MDIEALAFALRFDPARRIVVLPLPVETQRGEGWPALETLELAGFGALGAQTALDARRAVDACAAVGWQVDGLAGYSLGGCLAASVAGLFPDAFAGDTLTLWAAGGDLRLLLPNSEHWLATALRRPAEMSEWRYAATLAGMDPANLLARSRVAHVDLTAGWDDEIIPVHCAQALQAACEGAGIVCSLTLEQGGHWLDARIWAGLVDAFSADLWRLLPPDLRPR